jgi:outer membrane protein OmpA-like peptidoglycan-associated protein
MFLKTGIAAGATMSLAMVLAGTMCEPSSDRRTTRRSTTAQRRPPLVISFEDKQVDLGSAAVRDLAFVAGEARKDASLAVFVHGFARDEQDFGENLRLAESRARAVARVLIEHGAPTGRVLLAAAEETSDDDRARRCEVDLVRIDAVAQLLDSLQAARQLGDSQQAPSASPQRPD